MTAVDEPSASTRSQKVASYEYIDERGAVVRGKDKFVPGWNGKTKAFQQWRPDGRGGRITGPGAMDGVREIPYRLPELVDAANNRANEPVFVVEGEKDADRLAEIGLTATTSVGGTAPWPPELAKYFKGLEQVVVIADNDADDKGRRRTGTRRDPARPGRPRRQVHRPHARSRRQGRRRRLARRRRHEGRALPHRRRGPTVATAALLDDDDVGTTDDPDGGPSLQAVILKAKLLTVDQVKALPPPEPLIKGVLNRRKLGILWGKPGSGKSFVALDWGLSVATGSWWFGREVTQGLVVYLAAEGADGIGARLDAWQEDRQIYKIPAEHFLLLPDAVNLMDRAWSTALVEVVADLKPALVIADTLARSMTGGDENTSRDTGVVIDAANRIQQAAETTVLFVHHDTREGSNLRGSSALDGAVDTSIECKADGQNITLKSRKQKDNADFDDLRMWRQNTGASCVIWSHDRLGVSEGSNDAEKVLLRTIRECCGSDGLPASELMKIAELANSSYYRAQKSLLNAGAIRNVGTDHRPRYTATGTPDAP